MLHVRTLARVKTIKRNALLLVAAMCTYLIVREQEWVREGLGVAVDIASVLLLVLFTWVMLSGLRHLRALKQMQVHLAAAADARETSEQIKADFVSFVTHQLRTPLAGIRWMLELAEQGELDEETASCVEDARLSAERLIALVNDLLDVARLESGRVLTAAEPTAIADVTQQALEEMAPLAAAREQQVIVDAEAVPPVLVDPQLARQAVLNFLSNAIKYTPHGGSIRISAVRDGNAVRWSVRDTGIGVPSAAQARLFEKFFRAENAQIVDTEGTGLGLYLVRLIAQRAGGSVACESSEGEGSTFTLTLPVAQERKAVA
jgi:signal transduction histidine kinase